jgi:ethanolamine ammonia-lyase small subunit
MSIELLAMALGDRELVEVRSRAASRETYLQRPDLGRLLEKSDEKLLAKADWEVAIIIGDGLSATAVHRHAAPLVLELFERLPDWRIAPLVVARHARVALGDEIGTAQAAKLTVILIGERPGLTAPDSLGAYITWAPRRGRVDSERNCVSNIRPPHGQSYAEAANRIVWLMRQARARKLTGVNLKDDAPALSAPPL